MTKQAVRRPGLWIAAAATVALLLATWGIVSLSPHGGSGSRGGVAEADTGDVAAILPGEPHPDAGPGGSATGGADGTGAGGSDGTDGTGAPGAGVGTGEGTSGGAAGGSTGSTGTDGSTGGSGTTGGTTGSDGTSGTGTGTGATTAPTAPATDPSAGAAGAPAQPAQPVVPTLDVGLTINQAGSILTGNKSAGTVTVQAKNVGPVSLGGTLAIDLPSGVQYDDGLVRSILGLVSNLVTTGAVQTCSHTSTRVVCQVVSLIPGAAASVSIPVAVASGAGSVLPTASFLLG